MNRIILGIKCDMLPFTHALQFCILTFRGVKSTMDDVIVRPRHARYNSNRKRRRSLRHDNSLRETIVRQVAISVIILVAISVLKSIDTPATSFLTDKVKLVLLQNIDLNSVYNGFDSVFRKLARDDGQSSQADGSKQGVGGSMNQSGDSGPGQGGDDGAVPASGSAYVQGDEDSLEPDNGNQSADVQGFVQRENTGETKNKQGGAKPATAGAPASESKGKSIFIAPAEGILGSPYGERTDPITKVKKFHYGVDIEANKGTPIKAAAAGQVTVAGTDALYGKYIKIDHGKGLITLYAHCSELTVRKGQKVKQGDLIAKVGDTGAAVGPHLHFEIWKDGKTVNPLQYIQIPVK